MDPSSAGPQPSVITTGLIVVSTVFPAISAAAILLRIVARRRSGHELYSDDYWAIASWPLTLVLSILVWVYAAKSGINYYNVDPLTGTESSLELVFLSSVYLQFPLAAVKIAILLFYKRLFVTPLFRTCVWFTIGLVSVWAIVFFFVVLTEIDPIAFPLTAVKLKIDTAAVGLAQTGTSFGLDLLVLSLPLPVISKLNMKKRRKIAVGLIFWLGAFCVIAAVVRTALLDISIREVLNSPGYSQVASQSKQYIFLVLEPNLSILAACLPTYGPLIRGGRAPESIIRSIRSIFSIRSNGSGRSGASGASANTPRSRRNYPRSPEETGGQEVATESQIELQAVEDWPGKGRQEVYISGKASTDSSAPTHTNPPQGISVTSGITIQRE